jgi:hypothetical protein
MDKPAKDNTGLMEQLRTDSIVQVPTTLAE